MKTQVSLKHLVPTMMLGLLLITGTVYSQDSKAFVGDWSGVVFIGGQQLEIVCHFELDEEGNLMGTIDSPSQGAFGMALANIRVESKKITFGVDDPNVGGDPQFDGMLDETGAKISGDFSQGGGEGTFELKAESGKTASETTESVKTHLGGCILLSPTGEVPSDLYQMTDIVQTDEYKPATKKLSVYGIVLIGRDDISDDFMRKVAKTIKEMFPQGEGIDAELQKEVLRNMYRYKTVIPFYLGHEPEFTPEEEAAAYITWNQNSICDIIMEGVSGQVNEVVEHILHFVTNVGLHYTFPNEWGISKTSKVYQAMQEAIEKEYYIVDQYRGRDSEGGNRVLLQEFAYWVIASAWNLLEPYGPDAEWKIIRTKSDLKEKLPLSYELFKSTIPKVMRSPSMDTLEEFKEFERSGKQGFEPRFHDPESFVLTDSSPCATGVTKSTENY